MKTAPLILDMQAIANLRALDDDGHDSFVKEIIGIYLQDIPERLTALKSAVASDDRTLYVRSAHTIKGSSANVGATELQGLAEQLEQRAKIDVLSDLDPKLAALEEAFARVKIALEEVLKK